jgi:hypothetical protein
MQTAHSSAASISVLPLEIEANPMNLSSALHCEHIYLYRDIMAERPSGCPCHPLLPRRRIEEKMTNTEFIAPGEKTPKHFLILLLMQGPYPCQSLSSGFPS